jgi:peptidoglycan hydrolase-like protein with peptidoglycan-binding domain
MTESTDRVTLDLPHLKPGSHPPPNRRATARVQQILNYLGYADHNPRIFEESGVFGDKTTEHVKKFQEDNGIFPADGEVGLKTWTRLLDSWAALPPLPLPPVPAE